MENNKHKTVFENIDEAQLYLYRQLLSCGEKISTRDMNTLELFPVYFSIKNPRARITTLKGRNWKFAPALGEVVWHLSGSKDVGFISEYLSNWKNFSEDKQQITGSCYGFKMFEKDSLTGRSRWNDIVNLLRNDRYSRRAVISLLDPSEEIDSYKLDISCTISLQFLVRNEKLDLIVNMRSNDLVWGLPYDFFLFSYLQEFMAAELEIQLGNYHHFTASLHLYEKHFELAKRVIERNSGSLGLIMPKVPNGAFDVLVQGEQKLRSGEMKLEELSLSEMNGYWKDLLKVLYFHHFDKDKQSSELEEFRQGSIYRDLI